jgi:hypothetical protein
VNKLLLAVILGLSLQAASITGSSSTSQMYYWSKDKQDYVHGFPGTTTIQATTQAPAVPIDKDSQIKLLRGWKDWQGDALELKRLEEEYKTIQTRQTQAQADVLKACADAVTLAKMDPDKFTCDIDLMTIVAKPVSSINPATQEKPADVK